MKLTNFTKFLSLALLAGLLTFPLVGCGVESEPLGVEGDDTTVIEGEEYIEGEEGT